MLLVFLPRFEEQLQQCLAEDLQPRGDFVGLPLYLPQSLVSTPAVTRLLTKSPASSAQEVSEGGAEKQLWLQGVQAAKLLQ